jgi:hypothetical protein
MLADAVEVLADACARNTGGAANADCGATAHTKKVPKKDNTTANADFRNIWWISRSFN